MGRRTGALLCAALGLVLALGVVSAARADALQDRVSAGSSLAADRGTTTAIALLDRQTGQYRDNGAAAHQRIESASVMKLFIADNLLRRQDLGQIRLSPTDWTDLGRMLRESYDAAASRFWSTYGANGMVSEVIARYGLREVGLTSNPRYWGNTLITAHDVVRYYQRLLDGAGGLSAASRDWIVDQLRRSTRHGDGGYQFFGLHDGLPQEPVIAQKQGWMCCVNGSIYRHSTGLVGPDGRFVLAVLSKEPSDRGAAHIEGAISDTLRAMFPEGRIPRVQNAIADAWYRTGGARGPLGMPVGDEGGLPDGHGAAQWFQHGAVYWSGATGAHPVVNGNLQAWGRKGYEGGPLRYPTTDEGALPDGRGIAQWFQGGAVYWTAATGSRSVVGGNLQAWARTGYENGPLRYPTTDEGALPDGRGIAQWFQGGAVYWTAATGSRSVVGGNLQAWARTGYENGPLRYPTTDEGALPDGRGIAQWFQGGAVYWTAATGAHPITAATLRAWGAGGYEQGPLGYPTSSPAALPDGRGTAQWFQGGAVYASPATGAHALPGPLLRAWTDQGAELGSLGYPVGDPVAVPGGGTQLDFQGGALLLAPDGLVSTVAPAAQGSDGTGTVAPAPVANDPVPATGQTPPGSGPAASPAPLPAPPADGTTGATGSGTSDPAPSGDTGAGEDVPAPVPGPATDDGAPAPTAGTPAAGTP